MKHLLLSILLLVAGAQSTLFAQAEPDIMTFVEDDPEFPGGENAMMKFIQENLVYPQSSIEFNVQGKIVYRFVVEKDGSISNIKVIKTIDLKEHFAKNKVKKEDITKVMDAKKDMEKAGFNVISSFPKFKPGKSSGKAVRCYMALPLNFTLN